jgi:hypothetical protein
MANPAAGSTRTAYLLRIAREVQSKAAELKENWGVGVHIPDRTRIAINRKGIAVVRALQPMLDVPFGQMCFMSLLALKCGGRTTLRTFRSSLINCERDATREEFFQSFISHLSAVFYWLAKTGLVKLS